MNNPLVSIILPLYNGRNFIESSINSVLSQSYNPFELLVIDDGSSDGSDDLVPSDPRIRLFRRQNAGVAASRNFGISQAKGTFLAFIDQDDRWYPEKLQLQMQVLLNDPEPGYVLTLMHNHLVETMQRPYWLNPELLTEDPVGLLPSTLVVRRRIFAEIGIFTEDLVNASDMEWFIRAKKAGVQMRIVNQVLLQRNIHEDNCSSDNNTGKREMFSILRQKIKAGGSNNGKE